MAIAPGTRIEWVRFETPAGRGIRRVLVTTPPQGTPPSGPMRRPKARKVAPVMGKFTRKGVPEGLRRRGLIP